MDPLDGYILTRMDFGEPSPVFQGATRRDPSFRSGNSLRISQSLSATGGLSLSQESGPSLTIHG